MGEAFAGLPMASLVTAGIALITVLGALAWRRRIRHKPPLPIELVPDPPKAATEPMIAVADLELEYRQRSEALKRRDSRIVARPQRIQQSAGEEEAWAAESADMLKTALAKGPVRARLGESR